MLCPGTDPQINDLAKKVWFVTAVSNPARYKSRIDLYKEFRRHVLEDLGSNLLTIECAFGDRAFRAVEHSDIQIEYGERTIDVRVKNHSWVWLKENLWNIGAAYLPKECDYICFCDADISFVRRTIAADIVDALQTYKIVQPFQSAVDLGPHGQVIGVHQSFGSCHARGYVWKPEKRQGKTYSYFVGPPVPGYGVPWHPGYAMAMKRTTFEKLGGLLDVGALGAGDHHMMAALIGKADLSYPATIHTNYKNRVTQWQERAMRVTKQSLGFVHGTIVHAWHGSKHNRQYINRWKILVEHAFDPETDLQKNSQYVIELAHNCRPALRDAMIQYFVQRNEDSVDL